MNCSVPPYYDTLQFIKVDWAMNCSVPPIMTRYSSLKLMGAPARRKVVVLVVTRQDGSSFEIKINYFCIAGGTLYFSVITSLAADLCDHVLDVIAPK